MVTRISDSAFAAGYVRQPMALNRDAGTGSAPQKTDGEDSVSISNEARVLGSIYAQKQDQLKERYASEQAQLEREYLQEKSRLEREYTGKKQALGIHLVV